MTISRICPMCGNLTHLEVPDDIYQPYVTRYEAGFGYLQDIPLPANEREFIKTGYCMECQEMLFVEPDDE